MKIRPVGGDELFHEGGRTDVTKVIVALSKFCERAYYTRDLAKWEHTMFSVRYELHILYNVE